MFVPSSENQNVPIENLNMHLREPYIKQFFSLWPSSCRLELANMIMILGVSIALDIDSQTESDKLFDAIRRKTKFRPVTQSDLDLLEAAFEQQNNNQRPKDFGNHDINQQDPNYNINYNQQVNRNRENLNNNNPRHSNLIQNHRNNDQLSGQLRQMRNEVDKVHHQILKSHEVFPFGPSPDQFNYLGDSQYERRNKKANNDYDLRTIKSEENQRFLNFQKNQQNRKNPNQYEISPRNRQDNRTQPHNSEITPQITESPPPNINLKFSGVHNVHISQHHLDDREIKGILSDHLSSPFYSKTRDSSPLNYYPHALAQSKSAQNKEGQLTKNHSQADINNNQQHRRNFNQLGHQNEKQMVRSQSQGRAVKDTSKNSKGQLPNYLQNVESQIRGEVMYHKFLKEKGKVSENNRNVQRDSDGGGGGFEFIQIREMNINAAPRRRFIEQDQNHNHHVTQDRPYKQPTNYNNAKNYKNESLYNSQYNSESNNYFGKGYYPQSQQYSNNMQSRQNLEPQRKQIDSDSKNQKRSKTFLQQQQAQYSDYDPRTYDQQANLNRDRYLSQSQSAQIYPSKLLHASDRGYVEGKNNSAAFFGNEKGRNALSSRQPTEGNKNYSIHSQNSMNILDIANNFLTSPLMNHFGVPANMNGGYQNPGNQFVSNNSNITSGTGNFGEIGYGYDDLGYSQYNSKNYHPAQNQGNYQQSGPYVNDNNKRNEGSFSNSDNRADEKNRGFPKGVSQPTDTQWGETSSNPRRQNASNKSHSEISSLNDVSNHLNNPNNKTGSSQSGEFDNKVQMILRDEISYQNNEQRQEYKDSFRKKSKDDIRSGKDKPFFIIKNQLNSLIHLPLSPFL